VHHTFRNGKRQGQLGELHQCTAIFETFNRDLLLKTICTSPNSTNSTVQLHAMSTARKENER
jgi:hypothetical protein